MSMLGIADASHRRVAVKPTSTLLSDGALEMTVLSEGGGGGREGDVILLLTNPILLFI